MDKMDLEVPPIDFLANRCVGPGDAAFTRTMDQFTAAGDPVQVVLDVKTYPRK